MTPWGLANEHLRPPGRHFGSARVEIRAEGRNDRQAYATRIDTVIKAVILGTRGKTRPRICGVKAPGDSGRQSATQARELPQLLLEKEHP